MMKNDKYNKVRILSDLSSICWFIEQHALDDAKKANDSQCIQMLEALKKDLDKHISAFDQCACK